MAEPKNQKGKGQGKGGKPAPESTYLVEAAIIILVIIGGIIALIYKSRGQNMSVSDALYLPQQVTNSGKFAVSAWFNILRPIFILLDALLFGLIIYCTIKVWPLTKPRVSLFEEPTEAQRKKVRAKDPRIAKHWRVIVERANTGTPENLRLAVTEADALVDHFLKQSGYEGEHMADRLTQIIREEVPSLDRLWQAHRLRNDLVHTPGFTISAGEAKEALVAFRDFLKDLGAL